MARDIDAATLSKLKETSYTIVNLLQFAITSDHLTLLTDAAYDITIGSFTYKSTAGMLSVTDINEEDKLTIEKVDIVVSAVKSEYVKLFLDYNYINRRVLIYRAVLDDNHKVIGTPFLVFDGRLDAPAISEDFQSRTATLKVSATSHWVDFDATNGRHTNDSEQQVLFPGDKFFEFAMLTTKDIKWGRE